jgi:tetratricopeptide (TPR) repeat protein
LEPVIVNTILSPPSKTKLSDNYISGELLLSALNGEVVSDDHMGQAIHALQKEEKFDGFYVNNLKGNIAMTKQDFDSAEKHMRKSLDLGLPMKEAEGANKLQLGMIAMQKGNMKDGESLIRSALRAGIPDKESAAMANLQMCQIMMQKREFRAAKDFFKKAKAQKPTTAQVVDQIKQIEKYISRMPG